MLAAQSADFFSMDRAAPHTVTVVEGHPLAIDCGNFTSLPQVDLTWNYLSGTDPLRVDLTFDNAVASQNQSLIIVNPNPLHHLYEFRCTLDASRIEYGYIKLLYQGRMS